MSLSILRVAGTRRVLAYRLIDQRTNNCVLIGSQPVVRAPPGVSRGNIAVELGCSHHPVAQRVDSSMILFGTTPSSSVMKLAYR